MNKYNKFFGERILFYYKISFFYHKIWLFAQNFQRKHVFFTFRRSAKGVLHLFFSISPNFQWKISTSFIGELAYFFKESEISLILSLQGERGIRRLSHILFLRFSLSPRREEGLDDGLTSFRPPPYGLRPLAVISKPAVFASLSRVLSNPLRGFDPLPLKQKEPHKGALFVSKEREGFEPSVLWQTPDFETGPFDHSGISPRFAQYSKIHSNCL